MTVRAAFFSDCFHEVNGVANTSRQLERFAASREFPMLSVHAGPKSDVWTEGSITRCEFARRRPLLRLDSGMFFDPLFLTRHLPAVERTFLDFAPTVVHITGPSDCGLMGMLLAHRHKVPAVASWHTNLHEYAVRRLPSWTPVPDRWVERGSLYWLGRFYGCAARTLAPNPELVELMERLTHRPSGLMERGVDTVLFHPSRRTRCDFGDFRIGYVGRLSTEKDVRCLVRVQDLLSGMTNAPFHFALAGQGDERGYLEKHLKRVTFLGVLRGEALARAYAGFDALLFPSRTDTFGNVVLESLASAVPPIVSSSGGPKYLVEHGETGFVCESDRNFAETLAALIEDPSKLASVRLAARRAALDRSWNAVFERLYKTYAALAGYDDSYHETSPRPSPRHGGASRSVLPSP